MKRLSMLLIPCIAISANAATFNAQGKTINSNDAKNPGIVKFEKNKAVAAKNNQNKPAALAKTYTPAQVTATKGVYDQNTRKYELNDNTNIPEAQYLSTIDQLEKADNPRKNDWSRNYNEPSMRQLPNKTGNTCYITNLISYIEPHYSNFTIDYTRATPEVTASTDNNGIPYSIGYYANNNVYDYSMELEGVNRCNTGPYANTCGQGIHIYSIAGDEPISPAYNGICTDSRQKNYKEGIKLFYANKFIRYYAPKAAIHYYKDRTTTRYAQHPVKPYDNNMHIGNIISSINQNQTIYNMEAAALDDYIYNNRVIEFAPYTNNGGKTGAGIALNAISVAGATGRIAFSNNTIPATYTEDPNNNPNRLLGHVNLEDTPALPLLKSGENRSNYQKPEIYNVSDGLFNAGTQIVHDNNEYEYEAISDAWGASTVSATMTADLLERHPFYKWHPEVVKALWVSASRTERTDNKFFSTNIYNRNNRNYIASLATFDDLLFNNKSRYWYGNNTDFLSNNVITFTEDVEPGQIYSFAIAWLVRGDYAVHEKVLSTEFNLTVSYKHPSGKTEIFKQQAYKIATYRHFPRVSIPAGVNKVTVTIERTRNTNDRIILGYNMHKMRYN